MAPLLLCAVASIGLAWPAPAAAFDGQSVLTLSNWARESGIEMHPSVEWENNGDEDWGLELMSKVNQGMVLIMLDSATRTS